MVFWRDSLQRILYVWGRLGSQRACCPGCCHPSVTIVWCGLKEAICMGLVTKMSAVMSREDEIAVRRKYDNRWFVEAIPLWTRQKGCVCVKNGDGFDGYVVVIGLALQPTKSAERINYIEELKDEEDGRNHGDRVATEALLPPSIWRSGIVSQIKGKRDAGAAICNIQKQ